MTKKQPFVVPEKDSYEATTLATIWDLGKDEAVELEPLMAGISEAPTVMSLIESTPTTRKFSMTFHGVFIGVATLSKNSKGGYQWLN